MATRCCRWPTPQRLAVSRSVGILPGTVWLGPGHTGRLKPFVNPLEIRPHGKLRLLRCAGRQQCAERQQGTEEHLPAARRHPAGFSAITAIFLSMALNMPPLTYLGAVIVAMLLGIFVLPRTANSTAGIGVIFGITGLLGFGLGSILSHVPRPCRNGPQTVGTAFGGTACDLPRAVGLCLTSKRDFSFMGGFLFAGMMVLVIGMMANLFLAMPALSLAISGGYHPGDERLHPVRHQAGSPAVKRPTTSWRPTGST